MPTAGITKSGKTAIIAALLKEPELYVELCKGFNNRTKVIVETHFVEGMTGIIIEAVFWNEGALKKPAAPPEERIKRYNELLKGKVGGVLKEVGFKELDETAEPAALNAHVDEVIKSLNGQPTNPELIKKLINTEGIDKYIKRIVLQVAPNDKLADRLKDIDLYIRDTRGLMDIVVEGDTIKNLPSLTDLGVDSLDAVIFVATDNIPECTSKLYRNFLKGVLEAVPVFMIARDKSMITSLNHPLYSPITYESVGKYTAHLQSGAFSNYHCDAFFGDAYNLMEDVGVVRTNDSGDWEFCEGFIDRKEVEYLVPYVYKLGSQKFTVQDVVEDADFKTYRIVCTKIFSKIIDDIEDLYDKMSSVRIPVAFEFLKTYIEMLSKDSLTFEMKPELKYYNFYDLINDITNPDCKLLGERNGITTMNNGKLRYPAAAVMSVTSCMDIRKIIDNTPIPQEMRDILPGATDEALTKLLSKTLLNSRYHFIDPDACVQQYFITNRYVVCDSIYNERSLKIPAHEVVATHVRDYIIKAFTMFIVYDKDPNIGRHLN